MGCPLLQRCVEDCHRYGFRTEGWVRFPNQCSKTARLPISRIQSTRSGKHIRIVINSVVVFVHDTRLKCIKLFRNTRQQTAAASQWHCVSARVESDAGAIHTSGVASAWNASHFDVTNCALQRVFDTGQHGPNLTFGPIFAPCNLHDDKRLRIGFAAARNSVVTGVCFSVAACSDWWPRHQTAVVTPC